MTHQTATIGDTVYFWFGANDTSGSGGDGATPLFDVREAGAAASAAPLLSGTPDLLTHVDYPAGCHEVAVAATTGNGFAANDTFAVFCTIAIDSQNPTGFIGSCTLTPPGVTNSGVVVAGSTASTIKLASGHVVSDDNLNGYNVRITSGTAVGQERTITDSTNSGDVCTIAPDWVVTPVAGDTYDLIHANNGVVEVDANGRVDVIKVAGTTQTAGDLAALITTMDAVADAIQAVTDQLAFTVANEVDVNLQSVDDAAISKGGSAPSSPYGQT